MSEITMLDFGKNGRLGNQLFQYASLIGLSKKYNKKLTLPEWEYSNYFASEFPSTPMKEWPANIQEPAFHYSLNLDAFGGSVNVHKSYLQSEKYWEHCKEDVLKALEFNFPVINEWFTKETIAIHIRRGDYVGNKNYTFLSPLYYILALEENFPNWRDMNLVFFSDDIEYAKIHFECLPNAFFSEGCSNIEDLARMSTCDNFIIANSSFSWWAAYLSQTKGKIVRPANHFECGLKLRCNTKDLYPENWIAYDPGERKIDLMDVTFMIPVYYDHKDRDKNMKLNLAMIYKYFETNTHVREDKESGNSNFLLHRTRSLNKMAKEANTPYVANWDADVIVAPMQILETVHRLRQGDDMVMPYDWRFARIPRFNGWHEKIAVRMDIGDVSGHRHSFVGFNPGSAESWGGAVFFNKKSFIEGGMENENFISFGPEDSERRERFTKLGYKVSRVKGPIYHLNHHKGLNSSKKHAYFKKNQAEFEKVLRMSKEELVEYVKTWPWLKD